jgi:tRNA threonylcarbamoyladenosine biosynthesis protein TsaB
VAAVSSLAAVAHRVATTPGDEVLVCNDARMGELYIGRFREQADYPHAVAAECVMAPDKVPELAGSARHVAGNGLLPYPDLRRTLEQRGLQVHDDLFPRADAVATLAIAEFVAGRAVAAADVAPVYVRDQVVQSRTVT